MSSDYSAGVMIHRTGGVELTPADEAAIRHAVDALREAETGFAPRYDQFAFRYGTSAGFGGRRDGVYIALSDYFIDDEMNDAPAEVLLQRDVPVVEELAAELQEKLGGAFEVTACFID